ncbi:hypothetical protein HHK36_020426 [Tetracentron sinense]|uniref:Uncharacterized protein n=1 Tax=Tetracentron sinense TaxID=13715 RepID=A0A835DBL8_TETSI|nr:hypothetical protein HHK36_020426 [Tetracentron sinense]
MGWSHPDISLEDVLKLIKGFVDILILASGYQSSALWDPQNIKKAVQWGLFFENVFKGLSSSEYYQDSLKELDKSLLEMTSNPFFPQGLAHLSSTTLTRGRDFVLGHLIHTLHLRDAHLSAILKAIVEMDLDNLRTTEYDCLNAYLDKLKLQNTSLNLVPERRGFIKDSMISSPNVVLSSADQAAHDSVSRSGGIKDNINPGSPLVVPNIKIKEYTSDDYTEFISQELLKRQKAVSCISLAERSLDILSQTVAHRKWLGSDNNLLEGKPQNGFSLLSEEQLVEFVVWNQWRSSNLSYLLDNRTLRLVSGANMIFSAPKAQWIQVFERLKVSSEIRDGDLLEIIELSLLGCIASRWSCLIEHFISVSYDLPSISKQYHEVRSLLHGRSQTLHSKEETRNSKENDIVEYLTVSWGSVLLQLWKLSPVLAAVAIPSGSNLFKMYLSEMETQFKGDSSIIRCCSCIQVGKEHKD